MSPARTSGRGRRFELVLVRLRPPTPRTVGMIAKHASDDSYHWVMFAGRVHAVPENLARLLAVAYLDEASGLLGRGDPRWAVPRAYLRVGGSLEAREPGGPGERQMEPFVREELRRIAAWLGRRHEGYLADLRDAFRNGADDERFRALPRDEAEARGILDPTGRALVAPPPPAIVTRTRPPPRPGRSARPDAASPDRLLPWRSPAAERG